MSKPRDKGLSQYRKKRDPTKTTEPFEAEPARRTGVTKRGRFVVHCHDASRLHYDLRIQVGGVLESFAVPKGPSLRLDDRRLAVHTEAHPLRYLDFEGVIPEGNYGAGAMIVWDRGRVSYPKDCAEEGLEMVLTATYLGRKMSTPVRFAFGEDGLFDVDIELPESTRRVVRTIATSVLNLNQVFFDRAMANGLSDVEYVEIVGVVRDIPPLRPGDPVHAEVWWPYAQRPRSPIRSSIQRMSSIV